MKVSDVDSIGHVRTRNIDNSKSKSVIYKQVQLTLLIDLLFISYGIYGKCSIFDGQYFHSWQNSP